MKKKRYTTDIPLPNPESAKPVPIVGDALVATGTIAEGRVIPTVVIDTSERSDIEDLVRAQVQQPPGDVQSRWGQLSRSEHHLALVLQFERPSNCLLILEFDVVEQGILIECILAAQALYIQPGREGDRVPPILDTNRIIVEVPELGFREDWRKIWRKELVRYYRKEGLARGEAQEAAKTVISQMQEISSFRIP